MFYGIWQARACRQHDYTPKEDKTMNMKDINIEEILAKAKEMQEQFKEMQKNFTHTEIKGIAGIDDADQVVVKATLDGMRMIKSLMIGKGALEQDPKVLTDLIIAAINNATEKLNGAMEVEVKKIYATPDALPGSDSKKDED
jgi:DNA-binding protein YbaB